MPILNPAKCGIEPGHMLLMLILVLCLCGAGLLVMFLGRRAQRDLQKESPRTETAFQKKLKWILLGLVALILVLSAMF
jgi:flagellar basal body-associated protein FliL